MTLLFVYGSLKQGFPNAHVNTGRRVPGVFRSVEALPFHLVGAGHLPCLVLVRGQGLPVVGEVYEVDDAGLAAMDRLERVGQPGGYLRERIDVVRVDDGDGHVPALTAWVYAQTPDKLDLPGPRIGPLAEYTLDHARHLHW